MRHKPFRFQKTQFLRAILAIATLISFPNYTEADDDPQKHASPLPHSAATSFVKSIPESKPITISDWEPWQEGFLDIHHINTGRGDTAYFVLPDGTTMVFDAGDLDAEGFERRNSPYRVGPARPDNSRKPGAWAAHYIKQVAPAGRELQLDYAVISHFHADHYGDLTPSCLSSAQGDYRLTGITELGEIIPIRKLIDRDYPNYDFPINLRMYYRKQPSTFLNYLAFASQLSDSGAMVHEQLQVGSKDQIRLKYAADKFPSFEVRNVKTNATIWTGESDNTQEHFSRGDVLDSRGRFNENPLSIAIKISYGNFDYFTGGDLTGLQGYGMRAWFDVETPTALAVGKVEVSVLNHHGNRDATNEFFLQRVAPRTLIQQSWCSDHPGQEVLHRMISRHLYSGPREIFATNIQPETQVTFGSHLTKNYSSLSGHIVVRVLPGGEKYYVLILDDLKPTVTLKKVFGPYPTS